MTDQQYHAHLTGSLESGADDGTVHLAGHDLWKGPNSPGAQRHERAARNRVEAEYLPGALEAHKKIEARGPFYRAHAYVREQIADYLDLVGTATHKSKYFSLADKLRGARRSFTWGVNYDLEWLDPKLIELAMQWDTKAGLVKLCPDDAREDARRIWKRHGPRITELLEAGKELHYAVVAMPNWDRGKLHSKIRAGFKHLHAGVMYGRT